MFLQPSVASTNQTMSPFQTTRSCYLCSITSSVSVAKHNKSCFFYLTVMAVMMMVKRNSKHV